MKLSHLSRTNLLVIAVVHELIQANYSIRDLNFIGKFVHSVMTSMRAQHGEAVYSVNVLHHSPQQ